jgi:hypothetical protein
MTRLSNSRLNDRIDALEARYGRPRLVREIIANNLRWEVVLKPGPKPVQVRKRR